ncbi:hypothetical protein FEZ35_09420 [Lactobacillus delbrueckii subsp. bulgaricus]|uniref:Uncharacterized protein n=1 Tax=Lactobacillus delbrueckii subsp. lactis TaxID=29397 RepID=A0A3G6KAF4_LACDL|nr:hypothetical protein LDL72_01145 [Lactobacillus delbrueckii subsp. lactis DSM 20072]AZA15419.1 MAG: hypothetical protein DQL93_01250 [Lactobacillus delbrueckii subsp. lactis]TLQ32312.1 hypothetical protein FEZ35_09420 [Lactobacillus delbrueckii subsp. bulgaricus]TXJ89429.1 hypothetical protein FU655_03525 [Lactobacillus delbrueckii]AZA25988.1 MAG: hypothetical protein DF199_10290 [Lactobacillus delbrueckii subsp. lactis]
MGKTPPLREIEPAARQVLYYSAILPYPSSRISHDVREYWVRLCQIVSFDMILPSVCFNSFNI